MGVRDCSNRRFSALQRAEIAEIRCRSRYASWLAIRFSALQRAEIAEITDRSGAVGVGELVSVLFNEPKLLKFTWHALGFGALQSFSALQRAEIAEIRG